jgi:predicted transcriptional regulator
MLFSKNIFSKIYSLLTVDGERLFYLALSSEEPEEDGFFFFLCEEWSERYDIPIPTIRRYLKHLEDQGLIIRQIRSLPEYSPYPIKKGGTYSFIKVLPPETEKDMTFFGKLYRIEINAFNHGTATFRDVYNLQDTIRFQYAFCDLKENDVNSKTLKNMEIGQQVVFKGCVKRNTENRPWIVDIWNIRPAEEFYDDRRN